MKAIRDTTSNKLEKELIQDIDKIIENSPILILELKSGKEFVKYAFKSNNHLHYADWSYSFSVQNSLPKASIKICCKWACKNPKYAYLFYKNIKNLDKEDMDRCIEGTKNTKYYSMLLEHIMNAALE